VLGDFPGYSGHVKRLPCKDISVLIEELDEHIFLFGTQIGPYGGGLGGVANDKFHLLDVLYRLEACACGGNLLLGCWHLRGVIGRMDFLELLTE
jgi:hypothetical protein